MTVNPNDPRRSAHSPKRMAAEANAAAGSACVSSQTVMKAMGTSEAPIMVHPWPTTDDKTVSLSGGTQLGQE